MTTDLQAPTWLGEIPALSASGRECHACGWWLPKDEFSPGEGPLGLRSQCKPCRRVTLREAARVRLSDPEERAKHVLVQRARKHQIAWELFRELRAEGRCAEWLAEHPFTRKTRGDFGYVYVLLNFMDDALYVGQAVDIETRLYLTPTSHRFDKEWWPEVAKVRVYTYYAKDYDEGERWKIQELAPLYNKVRPKPRREVPPEPLSVVEGLVQLSSGGV